MSVLKALGLQSNVPILDGEHADQAFRSIMRYCEKPQLDKGDDDAITEHMQTFFKLLNSLYPTLFEYDRPNDPRDFMDILLSLPSLFGDWSTQTMIGHDKLARASILNQISRFFMEYVMICQSCRSNEPAHLAFENVDVRRFENYFMATIVYQKRPVSVDLNDVIQWDPEYITKNCDRCLENTIHQKKCRYRSAPTLFIVHITPPPPSHPPPPPPPPVAPPTPTTSLGVSVSVSTKATKESKLTSITQMVGVLAPRYGTRAAVKSTLTQDDTLAAKKKDADTTSQSRVYHTQPRKIRLTRSNLDIPPTLTLAYVDEDFNNRDASYQLFATITKSGTLEDGHYACDIGPFQWQRYDDDSIVKKLPASRKREFIPYAFYLKNERGPYGTVPFPL